MKFILTLIIAIAQTAIVIIPLNGKLSDNRSRFPKNFTRRGRFLVLCTFVTVVCTAITFFLSERDERENKQALIAQLRKSDSTHQKAILEAGIAYLNQLDMSDKKTIEALARYSLKYDTVEQRIEKLIKDSSNQKIITTEVEDPNLELCSGEVMGRGKDSIYIKVTLCAANSTAYDVDIQLRCYIKIPKQSVYLPITAPFRFVNAPVSIDKGRFLSLSFTLEKKIDVDLYLFRIVGSFKKYSGKIIPVDKLTAYSITEKSFGPPNAYIYQEFIDFTKANKIQ